MSSWMWFSICILVWAGMAFNNYITRKKYLSLKLKEREYRDKYFILMAKLEEKAAGKPLTPPKPKAQDTPKRMTGPQLRRASERVNVEAFASLQERPNSEILQEQENG